MTSYIISLAVSDTGQEDVLESEKGPFKNYHPFSCADTVQICYITVSHVIVKH